MLRVNTTEPTFLNKEQIDRLEWLCDEDGFVMSIDLFASDLYFFLHEYDPDKYTIKVPWMEGRKKSFKSSKVQAEIKQLIKTLEETSPNVLLHISRNSNHEVPFGLYHDFMSALKSPYHHKKRSLNPCRVYLKSKIKEIAIRYNIKIRAYEKGEFVEIISIICTAANAPYNSHEMAKEIVKGDVD